MLEVLSATFEHSSNVTTNKRFYEALEAFTFESYCKSNILELEFLIP